MKTLNEFILERQHDFPFATGDLTQLLTDIGIASKVIHREVNKAGLVDILGEAGEENVQGEAQQKLDVIANEVFIKYMRSGGQVCGVGSEEMEDIIPFEKESSKEGKYVVLMDPLDGSSNIDVNVSIGTIFSIYRRVSEVGKQATYADFMQPGNKQVAAGYVLYGSSTMLVYTTGAGVNGFTLDPSIGEFCLSHPDIQTPQKGKIYSINEGNYADFNQGLKDYLGYCKEVKHKGRYIGSLVADVHRNLLKGGIYLYPGTSNAPNGKLRLLYECNPMAYIIEQAGGLALAGRKRVLDIVPEDLHQRVPFYAGSADMVKKTEMF